MIVWKHCENNGFIYKFINPQDLIRKEKKYAMETNFKVWILSRLELI